MRRPIGAGAVTGVAVAAVAGQLPLVWLVAEVLGGEALSAAGQFVAWVLIAGSAPALAAYVFSRPRRPLSATGALGYGGLSGLVQTGVAAAAEVVGDGWWLLSVLLGYAVGTGFAARWYSRPAPRQALPPAPVRPVHSAATDRAITEFGEAVAAHPYAGPSADLELALDVYERAKAAPDAQVPELLGQGRAALERLHGARLRAQLRARLSPGRAWRRMSGRRPAYVARLGGPFTRLGGPSGPSLEER